MRKTSGLFALVRYLPAVAWYPAVSTPSKLLPVEEYLAPTAKNGIKEAPWASQNAPVTYLLASNFCSKR